MLQYMIWFLSRIFITDGSVEKNFIIFEADKNSYMHIDNKNTGILIPGEGKTQGLDDTTLAAEAKYPISFTQSQKGFVLNLYYNESNSLKIKSVQSKRP